MKNKTRYFMKYLFSRYLLTATISAALLIGFSACSDDSSSSPDNSDTTPVNTTPELDEVTPESPIKPAPLTVEPNRDKSKFLISGGAIIDLLDTSTIPAGADIAFTDMDLKLFKISATGSLDPTPLQVTYNKLGVTSNVSWSDAGAAIIDNNKSDCGTFRLYATYKASYDANDPYKYVSRDSLDFVREDIYCQEEPETPEPTPEEVAAASVELTMITVEVGTKNGIGISLSSGGTAVPAAEADLNFTSDELTGVITIHASNGTKIAQYSNDKDQNYNDDWTIETLPPAPAHMSDFRFKEASLTTAIEGLDSYIFYIATTPNYNAETGVGFFAFTLQSKPDFPDGNGNYALTILIYKKS